MRPSWGSVLTYENALDAVKRYGEPDTVQKIELGATSVIAAYNKVLEKLKDKAISGMSEIVFQETDGTTIILATEFPPKKGTADDIFVFKKKLREVK
ncbi:MAG: hypothetical protein HYZ51_02115 [Candidatus Doudnabacteria bacterium]|nr:hypothetical protein [Candidatus Doudnabacteria bacterium]